MPENVFIAINGEALHSKSKIYIGRALARKGGGDLDEYQLWASLALELLGKAALAREHPSLVVDPTHWQSMFVAAGIKVTTDVKTITAKTLFQRLVHLVPTAGADDRWLLDGPEDEHDQHRHQRRLQEQDDELRPVADLQDEAAANERQPLREVEASRGCPIGAGAPAGRLFGAVVHELPAVTRLIESAYHSGVFKRDSPVSSISGLSSPSAWPPAPLSRAGAATGSPWKNWIESG